MQPPSANPPDDDETLLAELRRVVAVADPVPEAVRIAARAAIEWDGLDAELAALVHDSRVDEPELALRGDAGPRALTFRARELEIEVEVEAEPGSEGTTLRLTGQLVPPQSAQIAIGTRTGVVVTRADARGRFVALGVARRGAPALLAGRRARRRPPGRDRLAGDLATLRRWAACV